MTFGDLERRIARLEEKIDDLLEGRRWFGRAVIVIVLTTVAGITLEVLRLL
jgi:hypothetical protein